MSFVGTRPEVKKYVDEYTDEMLATLLLPAGVTSLASIKYKDEDSIIGEVSDPCKVDDVYVNDILPDKMKFNLEYIEKFAFFSRAALSALPVLSFKPDLVHCHDWQTGLIPVHLKVNYANQDFYRNIKTVMTIHNLKFQGRWDVKSVKLVTGLSDYYFTPDKLGYFKDGNLLKGGLTYADAITTVSATYAEEIKTEFYGEKLNGLLTARRNDLRGIVNGIDYGEYNPETDKYILHHYNASNFRKEKIKNNGKACVDLLTFF